MELMKQLEALTATFVGTVWGLPLVCLLVGAGVIFTVYFGFPQTYRGRKGRG